MIRALWRPGGGENEDAYAVRRAVFIDEMGYADEDIDTDDQYAWHLTVYDEEKRPVGAARLFLGEDGAYCFGRIAVLASHRGQGYGDLIMRALLFKAQELGARRLRLGARVDRLSFYERYGFSPTGERYMEQGAPHEYLEMAAESISLQGGCAGCGGCKN